MACTSNNNIENGEISDESQKEDVQENTKEVGYEVPNDSWELSPNFEHPIVDKDGKEITYTIVGNEETLGFTGDFPMNSENIHKVFWFYFGEENIYDKPVEVKGVKEGTEELVDLHSGTFYEGIL